MYSKHLLQKACNKSYIKTYRSFSQYCSGVTAYHSRVLAHQTNQGSKQRSISKPTTCIQASQLLPVQGLLQYTQVRWQSGDVLNAATDKTDLAADSASSVAGSATGSAALPEGYIPTPPSALENITDPGLVLNSIGEPTFASLGLNAYTPCGFVQFLLETLHVSGGISWLPATAIAVFTLRMCVFPIFVKAQKSLAQQANLGPTFMELQQKVNEARSRKDIIEMSRVGRQMNDFVEKHDYKPIRAIIAPMANGPIFVTFIWALRNISEKVPAMKEAGMFWVTDLSIADPYFILPALNAAVLALTIEMGTDAQKAKLMSPQIRTFMRCIPIGVFAFTLKMPALICVYWLINSIVSMGQAAVLRQPKVRAYFKIPEPVDHSRAEKYGVKLGKSIPKNRFSAMIKETKEAWAIKNKLGELAERDRAAERKWREAGSKPIQKTYKYDPTQVKAKAAKR